MALEAGGTVGDTWTVDRIVMDFKLMTSLPFLVRHSRHCQTLPDSGDIINQLLGIPKPRFKVGDRIKYSYINDDKLDTDNYGQLCTLYGLILWMIPDVKNKRWEYCILWDDMNPEYCDFYVSGENQDYLELA